MTCRRVSAVGSRAAQVRFAPLLTFVVETLHVSCPDGTRPFEWALPGSGPFLTAARANPFLLVARLAEESAGWPHIGQTD